MAEVLSEQSEKLEGVRGRGFEATCLGEPLVFIVLFFCLGELVMEKMPYEFLLTPLAS